MSLMSDPRTWVKAAVSTWPRFILALVIPAAILAIVVDRGTWQTPHFGELMAFFAFCWHVMFLYALRRTYLRIEQLESAQCVQSNNALERTVKERGALCHCESASCPAAQLGR
jgi:hypothetical protein